MDYSADLAMRSRMSPWQCMDCKTCFVCDDSGDADSMLFCDACDKGYHMSCHAPKVSEKPVGKWVCWQCTEEIKRKKEEQSQMSMVETMETVEVEKVVNQTIDGAPGLPTPCESPVPEAEQNNRTFSFLLNDKNSFSENKENDEVPDASNWTIEDVENYFKGVGFPEQALAFKDQEIDGKSLLLLKRSDVLTGLSIKLGPALKIYNHVKRLQTRRSDGHLIC